MVSIILLIVSFLAFIQDISIHKIKNWYIVLALSIGIFYHFLIGNGSSAIFGAAMGMIFYLLFVLRFMGAGDVKMFCVLGAWATFPQILYLMAYCVFMNGIVAFIIMISRKNGKNIFRNFWIWLKICCITREYIAIAEEEDKSDKYPYMTGVFLGVIAFCIIGGKI